MHPCHRARHPRGPRAVALVTRSLAHPSPGGGARMRLALVVAALLLLVTPAAGALDVDLKAYDDARRRGETTAISGRAYTERRKPNAADTPIALTVVVVLPTPSRSCTASTSSARTPV